MPATELIVACTALLSLLIGFVVLVRFFRAWLLHRTLRKAIEQNSASAPALIDRIGALDDGRNQLGNDDRNGMVLIAVGLAMIGFSLLGPGQGSHEMQVMASASMFPLFVGVALLVRRWLLKRELAAETAAERGA